MSPKHVSTAITDAGKMDFIYKVVNVLHHVFKNGLAGLRFLFMIVLQKN